MYYVLNGGTNRLNDTDLPELAPLLEKLKIDRILFLNFASKSDRMAKFWFRHSRTLHGKEIELLAWSDYATVNGVEKIKQAEAIFIMGGSTDLLLERLEAISFLNLITVGQCKIMIGQSAGAMVLGAKVILSSKNLSLGSGLNLLNDYLFDVHFSQRERHDRLEIIAQQLPAAFNQLGIDENTSVIFNDQNIVSIAGQGRVFTVRQGKTRLYDLR